MPPQKFTTKDVRQTLRRMTKEQVLMTARGAVDELLSRNLLKCAEAMSIFDTLAPERFGESIE